MKYIIPLFIITVFASCFPRVRPVKETYVDPPFEATSSFTKEVVWDKIINLFAQKGLSLKIKDKSSGVIASKLSVLSTTIEDRSGKLRNKSAWVVVPAVYNPHTKTWSSQYTGIVLGEWSVGIKESAKGTIITVSLLNLKRRFTAYKMGEQEVEASFAKSTGVFERLIAEVVK